MTLLPVEPARLTIDPRRYSWCAKPELQMFCSVPGCGVGFGLHTHHIVPRSQTGGPLDYVTIDGLVRVNVCKLCPQHHADLTSPVGGHRAMIRWVDGEGWCWAVRAKGPGTADLTDEAGVCSDGRPAGVGSLFRSARGHVWHVVGRLGGQG